MISSAIDVTMDLQEFPSLGACCIAVCSSLAFGLELGHLRAPHHIMLAGAVDKGRATSRHGVVGLDCHRDNKGEEENEEGANHLSEFLRVE